MQMQANLVNVIVEDPLKRKKKDSVEERFSKIDYSLKHRKLSPDTDLTRAINQSLAK